MTDPPVAQAIVGAVPLLTMWPLNVVLASALKESAAVVSIPADKTLAVFMVKRTPDEALTVRTPDCAPSEVTETVEDGR